MKLAVLILYFTSIVMVASNDNGVIGARSSAMAKSSVCLSDVWSTRNNQGGLGFVSSFEAGAFFENRFLMKELTLSGFAVTAPIKNGTFGFNYSSLGYKLYKESQLSLSYGLKLGETISAGLSLDYLNTRIGDIYGQFSAFTGSFGFMVKLQPQLVIATHIYNPFRTPMQSYNHEKMPTIFKIGAQYILSDRLFLIGEAEKISGKMVNLKSGIEYNPAQLLFIRLGVGSYPTQMTFGLGVVYNGLKIDVSSAYQSVLGFSNQIGLSYCFLKTHEKSINKSKTNSSY